MDITAEFPIVVLELVIVHVATLAYGWSLWMHVRQTPANIQHNLGRVLSFFKAGCRRGPPDSIKAAYDLRVLLKCQERRIARQHNFLAVTVPCALGVVWMAFVVMPLANYSRKSTVIQLREGWNYSCLLFCAVNIVFVVKPHLLTVRTLDMVTFAWYLRLIQKLLMWVPPYTEGYTQDEVWWYQNRSHFINLRLWLVLFNGNKQLSVLMNAVISCILVGQRSFDSWSTIQEAFSFFSIITVAILSERWTRQDVVSNLEVETERATMDSLVTMVCDARAWLAADGDTVIRSDVRLTMLTGVTEPRRLSNLQSAVEADRFQQAISMAPTVDQPAPVTILHTSLQYGQKLSSRAVDFLIVDRRGNRNDQVGFLVGICVKDGDFINELGYLKPSRSLHFLAACRVSEQKSSGSGPGSVTSSGIVFNSLDLERVAGLGIAERWLIKPEAVSVDSSVCLGTGGFGRVLAATLYGTPVVVKVPHEIVSGAKASWLLALNNEIRHLRRVRHPNIVQFHGAVVFHGVQLAIVLERVDGVILGVCAASLERDALVAIGLGLCRAMRYLHALEPPIIHGDMTPRNVIVTQVGFGPQPKVIDFGLSRAVAPKMKSMGGTVGWMAPETISKKQSKPTLALDVFALGSILYWIENGEPPMAQPLQREKLLSAERIAWQPLREVMSRTARLLAHECLAPVPDDRPSLLQGLSDALASELLELDATSSVQATIGTAHGWKSPLETFSALSTETTSI